MSIATELDSLQTATLGQAFRFRIPIPELFEKLPIYHDAPGQAAAVLESLASEHEYLERIPLFGKRLCYKLAARFSRDFPSVSDFDTSQPLKEADKLKSYAMLRFCLSASDVFREPLTAGDFEQHFPELYTGTAAKNKSIFRNYYRAPPRLGYLCVDSGGEGSWRRILTKAQRHLQNHRQISAYQTLIDNARFELGVVTTFETKAKRIRDELTEQMLLQRVPLRVLSVPELLNLDSPPPLDSL